MSNPGKLNREFGRYLQQKGKSKRKRAAAADPKGGKWQAPGGLRHG